MHRKPIRRNADLQAKAKQLRKQMTDAERHLWQALRGRQLGGIKFRRQYVIGNYIVDFVSLEQKLIIELDGGQHAQQINYDAARTEFLTQCGFRVLRFWNHEVLQHTAAVLEQIMLACESFCPHPSPPPLAGEGVLE